MLFQLMQIIYWLALATWFGGVLFIAVSAPVIFRTVRENHPVLPDVLSVNLEGQHGTLLAGAIVGNLLQRLFHVEIICIIALVVAMIAQFFLIDLTGDNFRAAILRWVLFGAATAIVLYDRLALCPRIWQHRQRYIEHADEPELANPAKEIFDREHRRSVTLLSIVLFALLGMILFSGNIMPRPVQRPIAAPTANLEIDHDTNYLQSPA